MKAGAVDFLTKPVGGDDLLAAVHRAMEIDRLARHEEAERLAIRERIATLTRREREVLERVIAGGMNKQIAADLGTVEKTIKHHRSQIVAKLGVRTLPDILRMAKRGGVEPARLDPSSER
jgi:FixJ family two-component response regulator